MTLASFIFFCDSLSKQSKPILLLIKFQQRLLLLAFQINHKPTQLPLDFLQSINSKIHQHLSCDRILNFLAIISSQLSDQI